MRTPTKAVQDDPPEDDPPQQMPNFSPQKDDSGDNFMMDWKVRKNKADKNKKPAKKKPKDMNQAELRLHYKKRTDKALATKAANKAKKQRAERERLLTASKKVASKLKNATDTNFMDRLNQPTAAKKFYGFGTNAGRSCDQPQDKDKQDKQNALPDLPDLPTPSAAKSQPLVDSAAAKPAVAQLYTIGSKNAIAADQPQKDLTPFVDSAAKENAEEQQKALPTQTQAKRQLFK